MNNELKKLRRDLEKIDKKISKLLKKREEKVKKIGKIKKREGIPIKNEEIEKKKIDALETEYEKSIFSIIIEESRKIQG